LRFDELPSEEAHAVKVSNFPELYIIGQTYFQNQSTCCIITCLTVRLSSSAALLFLRVLAVLQREEWRIASDRGARRAELISSIDCKLRQERKQIKQVVVIGFVNCVCSARAGGPID